MQVYLLDPVQLYSQCLSQIKVSRDMENPCPKTSPHLISYIWKYIQSHHWINYSAFYHLGPKLPGMNREPETPCVTAQPLNHLSKNKEKLEV